VGTTTMCLLQHLAPLDVLPSSRATGPEERLELHDNPGSLEGLDLAHGNPVAQTLEQ